MATATSTTTTTIIIGIGGPSGSGKSTLARNLRAALGEGEAEVMSLDSYYFPLHHLTAAERAARNFDHPDAIDWNLITAHLDDLRHGRAIQEPIYRFDLHTRDLLTRRVLPKAYIIVEGILALHQPAVRAAMNVKVYIETHNPACYRRRLERDTRERGRSEESVMRQYRETVLPMAEQFVFPTRAHADLVVSGEYGYTEPVKAVLKAVRP